MRIQTLGCAVAVFCLWLGFPAVARSQAVINESLETATLYVDAINGNDSNPGTAALPLQTIGASVTLALANNYESIGTKVIVNPGTYRETVNISSNFRDTTLPITFEAATAGTAIVSGAQLFTGWTPSSGNSAIYTVPWTNNWGLCPNITGAPAGPDVLLRREMIFVNGTAMTQVTALSQVRYPGMFFVDETGGKLYLWPPSGTNLATAAVEVAIQPSVLSDASKESLVFRGLVFEYAATCRDNGAVYVYGNAKNILFDNDQFVWNNAHGLDISNPVTAYTVQNSTASHNGESGFQETQTNYSLWLNNLAEFNNWRGALGANYNWNSSGFHFFQNHEATYNGLTTAYNQTHGTHWDTDNVNVTVTGLHAANNLLNGIMVEKSEGPVNISASTSCFNDIATHDQSDVQGGLLLRNSTNVSFTNSTLFNSAPSQINIQGQKGGITISNWETGTSYNLITSYITLTNDVIDGTGSAQFDFRDSYLDGTDWTPFQTTLVSNSNIWWEDSNPVPFSVPSPTVGTSDTFAGWQALTGQDLNSTFVAPPDPTAACTVAADSTDFWLIAAVGTTTPGADGNAPVLFSVPPIGGYSGTVNLVADTSQAPGITATLSNSSVVATGGVTATSTVTFTTATNAVPGSYPVTILANAGNVTRASSILITVPQTSLRLSAINLTFGSQTIGTSSAGQTFTVTNTGSTALSIASIVTSTNFADTTTCGVSLAAGKSCTVTVTLVPQTSGSLVGTVTLTDGDLTSPQIVNLTGTGISRPTISISPGFLAYASVSVGGSSVITAVLTNTSLDGAVFVLGTTSIGGTNPGDYSQINTCGGSIAAGATCTFTVTFTPKTTGLRTATISFTDNTYVGIHTVNLTGSGVTAALTTLAPTALTFASQVVGSTSSSQTVTLTNNSDATKLTIISIALGGLNGTDFTLANGCGLTLMTHQSCTMTVTFTPTAVGTRSATITIVDTSLPILQTVTITGTAITAVPTVTVTPSTLSFGSVNVGTKSSSQTVILKNTSTSAALAITSIAITGTNSGDFSQTNPCGTSLAAGASCTITANFTPTVAGSRNASITITDNASPSTQTVSLTGTGLAVIPTVTVTPASLSFGSVNVGTKSSSQTVILKNTSTSAALAITSIAITGTNSGDFSQTNPCGTSLAAGASCTITANFTPTVAGSRNAFITITDNASPSTQTVSLTGTGVAVIPTVTVTPTSLDFGSVNAGSSSSKTVILKNTSAATSLTITSITVGGTDAVEFTQTNPCGTTLAAGASCVITVTYAPTKAGTVSASLTLVDNASPSTQTVSLTGTGIELPTVTLTPATLDFGSVNVNTKSSKTVTLTNTSSSALLTITAISLMGSSKFTQTNTCGSSLAEGASCTITVTFKPISTAAKTSTLRVTDNTSGGSQTVALSGMGK